MNIYAHLNAIQCELNAPKNAYNDFGNYNYRSCESILAAVKPMLKKYNLVLTLTDDLVFLGDRYYVKATATIFNADDTHDSVSATAYAREADAKKGLDSSQLTGSTSSYARKYALSGLLAIDDNKDADTNEHHREVEARAEAEEPKRYYCEDCGEEIRDHGKFSAKSIADRAVKAYGKPLCYDCASQRSKEKENN